jgi:hypothetical protein
MVAVAIEPNKATAYVCTEPNGIQQGVNSISHVPQRLSSLKIGWDQMQENRRFKGLIDDVRIYNCALGKADVEALYSGKALPTAVAKVTLEMPAAGAVETPTGSGQVKTLTADTEESSRGKNWIAVLIIVAVAGIAVALITLRRKAST